MTLLGSEKCAGFDVFASSQNSNIAATQSIGDLIYRMIIILLLLSTLPSLTHSSQTRSYATSEENLSVQRRYSDLDLRG